MRPDPWLGAGSPQARRPSTLHRNRVFKSAGPDGLARAREALLKEVLYVPILDARGRLQAWHEAASPRGRDHAGRRIASDSPTFVIAEIGNNTMAASRWRCA